MQRLNLNTVRLNKDLVNHIFHVAWYKTTYELTEDDEDYIADLERRIDALTPNTRIFNGSSEMLTYFKMRKYLRLPRDQKDEELEETCKAELESFYVRFLFTK